MVPQENDCVVDGRDIHGTFRGDILQGTTGVLTGHRGHDMPPRRVRFTITPGGTAVVGDLTDADIGEGWPDQHTSPHPAGPQMNL